MKTIVLIFILLITADSFATTNEKNIAKVKREVKGRIIDYNTEEPIPYAHLNIVLSEDTITSVALLACDIDGNFSVSLEHERNYILKVSYIGKQSNSVDVFVPSGTGVWQIKDIKMKDDAQLLKEIVVAAQKPLIKTDTDKIIYSIEDDKDASVSSALDMMRKVPMVTVDGDDNIQLQGSSNFLIYVDGKPSSLMSNNPSDVLKSLPASTIKNIEVITEPGARYDAEGTAGVINIVTVKRILDGYTASVNAEAHVVKEYGGGAFLSMKSGKLGLTANYNYATEEEPLTDMQSVRENFADENSSLLQQTGTKHEVEKIHRGFLEATYEIDSLNLISIGANIFHKKQHEYSDYLVEMSDRQGNGIYSYNRNSYNYPSSGTIEVNADYQHETSLKGEMLTLSYRFTNKPSSDENRTFIDPVSNYSGSQIWDSNTANTNEHVFQVDYVRPVWEKHELEMGAKYVMRFSSSEIIRRTMDSESGEWVEQDEQYVDFGHNQHISALYFGDSFRWNRIGIKGGVRAEGTFQSVNYRNAPENNFRTSFVDIVPNLSLSYSIADNQQIRMGYNMRIRRAGIDRLNPYVDETDPLNISYGNPDLDSEKSHRVNLNYGLFTRNFNMNATIGHSFVNNSIESYTFMDPERPNVAVTTYGNIGRRNETRLSLYMNWMPADWLRIFVNSATSYVTLSSGMNGYKNDGISGQVFGGVQVSMPWDFRMNINAGYIMPKITLQGYQASFMSHDVTLSKDFWNRRLTVSLYCKSPLFRVWQQETKTESDLFRLVSTEGKVMRNFGIKLSFRMGNLMDSIKKIKRGIINDDIIE